MTAMTFDQSAPLRESAQPRCLGVVVIGRNEGDRLRRCLQGLGSQSFAVVYVDSGSVDGSRELARSLGVEVVELDNSIPFTAARARSAGFGQLTSSNPSVEFVQFVDGDCEIVDGWLEAATSVMRRHSDLAVVCGRRRERFPDATVYNRIVDLEWDTPVGSASACGGDALMRVSALKKVGGFNESVAAGEEPELCERLRQAGGKIERIDKEMTLHDAAVSRFSQWWKRHLRSGYGGLDVQRRLGVNLFDHELASARRWTIGWAAITGMAALQLAWIWGPVGALLGTTIGFGLWLLQALRMARTYSRRGFSWTNATRAAVITMVVKWANLAGQIRYWRDNRSGRATRLIEYKPAPPNSHTAGFYSAR